MKKKKIILIITVIFIIALLGVSYAVMVGDLSKIGRNQELVVGDIYMHYKESNSIMLENVFPSDTYDSTKYFEFTIDGKNTNKSKDIVYDIILNHGDNHQSRTERINDIFLKFTLVEIKNNEEVVLVDSKSYPDLTSTRIWKDVIEAETNTEVVHTYRLYIWISNDVVIGDGDYDEDTWNNEVYASIKVTVTGDFQDKNVNEGYKSTKILLSAINKSKSVSTCKDKTYIEEDGITYISGSKDCIDFNYLWYSGRLWRITAIYPDGAMKLVTENTVTNMNFDSSGSVNFYTDENNNSDIYKYLNNDFYNTLITPENVIDTTKSWNATMNSKSTKPADTTMISGNIAKVGLINSYEYIQSYKNLGAYNNSSAYGNGYLRLSSNSWWLLNPYNSSNVRYVYYDGRLNYRSPASYSYGVRPSIYLKSDITLTGNGTIENPYKIKEIVEDETSLLYKTKYKQETTSCKTYVEEDGITYISGSEDCIDFNYVWYSGKLWRITAIYPDGSMKLITEDAITAINWGSNAKAYYDTTNNVGSWVYQWLNEDFYDTLVKADDYLIKNAEWNYSTDGNSTPVKPSTIETQKTTNAPVGLLSAYEYSKGYTNASANTNYLNIGYVWWLITPYSSSRVRYVGYIGSLNYGSPSSDDTGVRPSVYLKSGINLTGTGTKTNPFEINDNELVSAKTGDLLSSRISGEYVEFDNDLYRIVSTENDMTKLTRVDYLRDETSSETIKPVLKKNFASSAYFGKTGNTDYWDYYLNNTWYDSISSDYQNMMVDGTFYLGLYSSSGSHYKITICSDAASTLDNKVTKLGVEGKSCTRYTSSIANSTFTGKVGLSRVGEMFSAQLGSGYLSSSTMWLITPDASSNVLSMSNYGSLNYYCPTSNTYGVRPSIYLKSTVKILSGSGTELDPYIVG